MGAGIDVDLDVNVILTSAVENARPQGRSFRAMSAIAADALTVLSEKRRKPGLGWRVPAQRAVRAITQRIDWLAGKHKSLSK